MSTWRAAMYGRASTTRANRRRMAGPASTPTSASWTSAGFPKTRTTTTSVWWGDKPVVHLLPHWNWPGKEGQNIDVWVHSNADRVELFLNGTSLGAKDMPRLGHLEWKVPYAPGKLEAKGYKDGKLIASDVVETTGAATQIRLTPDRKTMKANGEEVIMVEVALLDDKGRVVPYADNEVTFDVRGAGQVGGVGNGDPSSHEPDKASKRHAFHGLCMAVIQAAETPGSVQVMATAPGLKSATVRCKPASRPKPSCVYTTAPCQLTGRCVRAYNRLIICCSATRPGLYRWWRKRQTIGGRNGAENRTGTLRDAPDDAPENVRVPSAENAARQMGLDAGPGRADHAHCRGSRLAVAHL